MKMETSCVQQLNLYIHIFLSINEREYMKMVFFFRQKSAGLGALGGSSCAVGGQKKPHVGFD